MKQYHKIQTVYFRDPENNNRTLLEGTFAKEEFKFLRDAEWTWTEKIDGTNIRVMFDGEHVRFGGKTDNAQIPTNLLETMQDTFDVEGMKKAFPELEEGSVVCLYGEGYGKNIQKGHNYIKDKADFILFDVNIDGWWLLRPNCEDIAEKLGLKIVPIIGTGSLLDAVEYVRKGFASTIADNTEYVAEGLIMKPTVELFNRKGERIISKIKYKDFPRQ